MGLFKIDPLEYTDIYAFPSLKEPLGGTNLITNMITLGIDVGGTFTDLVMRDARTGEMRSLRRPQRHLAMPTAS